MWRAPLIERGGIDRRLARRKALGGDDDQGFKGVELPDDAVKAHAVGSRQKVQPHGRHHRPQRVVDRARPHLRAADAHVDDVGDLVAAAAAVAAASDHVGKKADALKRPLHFGVKGRVDPRIAQGRVQSRAPLACVDDLAAAHGGVLLEHAALAGKRIKPCQIVRGHALPPDVDRQAADAFGRIRGEVSQKRHCRELCHGFCHPFERLYRENLFFRPHPALPPKTVRTEAAAG